jgi:hypothetical protein
VVRGVIVLSNIFTILDLIMNFSFVTRIMQIFYGLLLINFNNYINFIKKLVFIIILESKYDKSFKLFIILIE